MSDEPEAVRAAVDELVRDAVASDHEHEQIEGHTVTSQLETYPGYVLVGAKLTRHFGDNNFSHLNIAYLMPCDPSKRAEMTAQLTSEIDAYIAQRVPN